MRLDELFISSSAERLSKADNFKKEETRLSSELHLFACNFKTRMKKNLAKMGNIFCCAERQESTDCPRRKMVIVGDGECGKTCLVKRMHTGAFSDNGYLPTVFETELINVHTGDEQVELVINDTAGQEVYDRLRPLSYHDVDVVLICFSLAEQDTLANVREIWSPEIRYYCGDVPVILVGNKKDLRDIPDSETMTSSSFVSLSSNTTKDPMKEHRRSSADKFNDVTENAVDMVKKGSKSSVGTISTSSRQRYHVRAPVKHSEGAFTATRIGAVAYFETSALTGENVKELLLATTKAAVLGSQKSKKFKPFIETMKIWKSMSTLEKEWGGNDK